MTDQQFREQHQPIHVPAAYQQAQSDKDRVVFALADIGEGTADAVARHLRELDPQAEAKQLIALVHQVLTELYNNGQIAGNEREGNITYNLHKITQANDGAVNPDLLAPGLD